MINKFTVFFQMGISVAVFCSTTSLLWAKNAPQKKIHVNLLGQPCLLQGPYDESTLRTVHAIGPAQLYPTLSSPESPQAHEQVKRALEKLRTSNSLPSLLDLYREKLGKRLEAQVAFMEGVVSWKRTLESGALLRAGKRFLREAEVRSFETLLKKLSVQNKSAQGDSLAQLFEAYNGGIQPDPESEFHSAIKKMNVEYICSFEESGDD